MARADSCRIWRCAAATSASASALAFCLDVSWKASAAARLRARMDWASTRASATTFSDACFASASAVRACSASSSDLRIVS